MEGERQGRVNVAMASKIFDSALGDRNPCYAPGPDPVGYATAGKNGFKYPIS